MSHRVGLHRQGSASGRLLPPDLLFGITEVRVAVAFFFFFFLPSSVTGGTEGGGAKVVNSSRVGQEDVDRGQRRRRDNDRARQLVTSDA